MKLITGPRRAGKSVFSLLLLRGKRFAYLNFDDDKLLKEFDEEHIMQVLKEVYSDYDYLLLDEPQNLPIGIYGCLSSTVEVIILSLRGQIPIYFPVKWHPC